MFVLELEFDDDDQQRLAGRPAHRERLFALHAAGTLVMAGPWPDDSGALLVFDTDRDRMDRVLADDPYYATAGVRIKAVREWQPIVGQTRASI